MGNVLVDNLEPGMTLNTDVTDSSGRLLVRGGTVISKDSIRMLRNRLIEAVDIQGVEEEKVEPDEPVQPEPPVVNEPPETFASSSPRKLRQ